MKIRNRDQALEAAINSLDLVRHIPFTDIDNHRILKHDQAKCLIMAAIENLEAIAYTGFSDSCQKALEIAHAALNILADEMIDIHPCAQALHQVRIKRVPTPDYIEYCQALDNGRFYLDPRD